MRIFSLCIIVLISIRGHSQDNTFYFRTPLENGKITNGIKTGIWEYYETPTQLALKIDYDQLDILYIKPDTSDFVVLQNGKWVKTKLEIPSRYHGPTYSLYNHYTNSIKIPNEFIRDKKSFSTKLIFEVHENGVAKNPRLTRDPGHNLANVILNAFYSAPNAWIVGIDTYDRTVVSRFHIGIELCFNNCPESHDVNEEQSSEIFSLRTRVITESDVRKEGYAVPRPYFEYRGMILSPDNKKLAFESRAFNELSLESETTLMILDLENKQIKYVPYNSFSPVWLDNDNLLFKYTYYAFNDRLVTYNITEDKVINHGDSAIYYHVLNNERNKFIYSIYQKTGVKIYEYDLNKSKSKEISVLGKYVAPIPMMYSPNDEKMVFSVKDKEIQKIICLDVKENTIEEVPIYDSKLVGWSDDFKTLFLYKYKFGDYEIKGNLYQFDFNTYRFHPIIENLKKFSEVSYSNKNDLFALLINESLYIAKRESFSEKKLISKNVRSFFWNDEGSQIFYLLKKEDSLNTYDLSTGKSERILSVKDITQK